MTPAERAVIDAVVSRGYLTPVQVEQATSGARSGSILPALSNHLSAAQREELVTLYRTESSRIAQDVADDSVRTLMVGSTPSPGPSPTPVSHSARPVAATHAAPTGESSSGSGRLQSGPGSHIAGFEILGELGRGGMGVVYRARNVQLDREVALKVLIPTGIENEETERELVARFQVEAKAAARLRHPNIVGVLQQGQDDDGRWFMAMDLIQGESLDHSLSRDGALLPEEAALLILKSARALAYAHEQDVLHRDLKPHNIIVDEESGEPLITDFGLAKLVGNQQHSLTRTGSGLLGTPAYMPPEQADSDKSRIDARGDVYSLGATLYHLMTGRPPFVGETVANLLVQVITEDPPAPRSLDPQIPLDLDTICRKTLEKDPDDRYPSAAAFADDLERFLNNEQINAVPPSLGKRFGRWVKRNRLVAGVVVGATLVVALTVGFALNAIEDSRARQQERPLASAPPPPAPTPRPVATRIVTKTNTAEVDRLKAALEAKEKARLAAERKATDAERLAQDEAKIRLEAEAKRRREDAAAKAEAERVAKAKAEREAKAEAERIAKTKADREANAQRDPNDPATNDPRPTPTSIARFQDGMDPDPRVLAGDPGIPPSWMVHRLSLRTRTSRRLALARTWREAVTEARARNVPLVVISAGPNLRSHGSLKSAGKVFDDASVGLLSQAPHRFQPGEQITTKAYCPYWKTVSCTSHLNNAWWVGKLKRGQRHVLTEYDDGLPPAITKHNNEHRKTTKRRVKRPRPREHRPPPRGRRPPRGRPPPRPPPDEYEEVREPPEPAEQRPRVPGAWPASLKTAAALTPRGRDTFTIYVCRPDTLEAVATLDASQVSRGLKSALIRLQKQLGAPRDLLAPYLAKALSKPLRALLSAERQLEAGNVRRALPIFKINRDESGPLIKGWATARFNQLPTWTTEWIERQMRRGLELGRERLERLRLPREVRFSEARALQNRHLKP